ncbi:hypothetical protein [Pseudomonas putida]|uniref:hypothetical protein n=1 Tax=Pseudomonas putida TaxID=303 RepID=UPI0035581475
MSATTSRSVAPQGNYRAEHLTDVIEATYTDLRATANPNHLVAAGWTAIPTDTTLDDAEAAQAFCRRWRQESAESCMKSTVFAQVRRSRGNPMPIHNSAIFHLKVVRQIS